MKDQKNISVFLVDDDAIFLKALETQFKERTPYKVKTFSTGEECLKSIGENPNIVFLDYYLNTSNPKAKNGLQIMDAIKRNNPEIDVIMQSSQESLEVAVNCMKHEAFDYIVKGEAAFTRAQRAVSVLLHQKKLEKDVAFHKTTSIFLGIVVVAVVVIASILQIYHPNLMK